MEIEDILRENIGRYNLPAEKVLTQEVQDIYPKWEDAAREKFWWERDNIQSPTVFLQFHLCKEMPLDETLTEKAANLRKLHASFLFIHKLLLTIGGCETQLSDTGIDPNALIERGTFFASSVPIHFSSKEVDAKAEIAAILKKHPGEYQLFQGYSLADTGIWSPALWLAEDGETDENGYPIAYICDEEAKAYFGAKLDEEATCTFLENT